MSSTIHILLAITYIIIGISVIVLTLFLLKGRRQKKYQFIINNLDRDKNLIISANVLSELNKVESLINNDDLKKTYDEWVNRFNKIKDIDIPEIEDSLLLIDEKFQNKDYKDLQKLIVEAELAILYAKTKANYLLNEIQEITLSEEKNREIITRLKAEYRKILQLYHNRESEYDIVKEPIDLQIENIDKLFSAFEVALENNSYTEVGKIVKAIDDTIGNLKIIIEQAPDILVLSKNLVPNKLKELELISGKLISEGYNLDYLNLEYNKEEINKKVSDVISRLKVLNIEDSMFELKTILDYIESIYNDFEKEKLARRRFEEYQRNIIIKVVNLEKINNNLIRKLDEIKYSYDLDNNDVKVIGDIKYELISIKDNYDFIISLYRGHKVAFSKLLKEMDICNNNLLKTEEKLNYTLKSLNSLKEDEDRAREQLVEIEDILARSKDRINNYKLPVIPKNYFVELKEASFAIKEMTKELQKTPLSIKVLNTRVDTARDLTLKLYNTTKELVKTAKMAEMAIVYGNRYRPVNRDIDSGLIRSENLFYKGNYKGSLEQAINAINIVEPGIYERLLDEYQN